MTAEETKQTRGSSLSSTTYLNTRTSIELFPGRKYQKGKGMGKQFQVVQRDEIMAELDHVAEQMSYAQESDYSYLKGQYVVLYRILFPLVTEAAGQTRASCNASSHANNLVGKCIHEDNQEGMSDGAYLEFCGVGQVAEKFKLKLHGVVEYGDIMWCWYCERWEPVCAEEVGKKVGEFFTAELSGKGGE